MKTNKKASSSSEHYLYVEFLKMYQTKRQSFTYNSDDRKGQRLGLANLVKRVLNRSVKGKYQYAKLVQRSTGRVLGVFTPEGQYDADTWEKIKTAKMEDLPLKASVAFKPEMKAKREKFGLPAMQTIYGTIGLSKVDALHFALMDLRQQLTNGKYSADFRMAYVYWHPEDVLVAQIVEGGEIRILSKEFEKALGQKVITVTPLLKTS